MGERQVVQKAGGIVIRKYEGVFQMLVVHRPRYDDWVLPKGHIDHGESPQEAAVREVLEEAGAACVILFQLPQHTYEMPDGNTSAVQYFLMEPRDFAAELLPPADDEVDEVRWITQQEIDLLTYDGTKEYLQMLLQQVPPGFL